MEEPVRERESQRLQGRYNPHNVHQRLNRKEAQVAEKQKEFCDLKKELMKAKCQATKKSSMKAAYYKKRFNEAQAAEENCQECRELKEKLVKLQEEKY